MAGRFVLPFIYKSHPIYPRTEAINNIKQVGLSLMDFDAEYGCYPDESTAPAVKANTGTALTLGRGSSNQLFRQFIAKGLKTEKIFYAQIAHSCRPDDDFSDDAHALAAGECAFAYVTGLSSSADPETPIVKTPMIPGTTRFDPKIFGGRAIVLRVDNRAVGLTIDAAGHAIGPDGRDIFDPVQPYWKGKKPTIVWPE